MPALQLAPDDHLSRRIDPVNLKYRLCDIETDCRDRLRAWLPKNCDRPSGDHFIGTYVPVEEPSTASLPDLRITLSRTMLRQAEAIVSIRNTCALTAHLGFTCAEER